MNLHLDAITKQVGGDTHLYAMSLTFAPGLNVLLGPTQAGKSSLMRLMAGLDRPTTGRVREDDTDVTTTAVQKRSVAFVYQQFINYPSLTVFENIASPLRVQGGLRGEEIKRRVRETAAMMRIDHLLDRLPAALSGGQQQRTAIARALVKESNLLLLDEPLVNLDYKLRRDAKYLCPAQRDCHLFHHRTPRSADVRGRDGRSRQGPTFAGRPHAPSLPSAGLAAGGRSF